MISQSEDKLELIKAAAIRLFSENGFHATPTSLIAKEAGVSNGTLFHYFPTKEELINSLYIELKREIFSAALKDVNEKDPFFVTLKRIWDGIIDWSLGSPRSFLFVQQFANSPFISNIAKDEVEKLNKVFELFIKIGISRGELKPVREDIIFLAIYSQMMGTIRYLLQLAAPDPEVREASFTLLARSLKSEN